MYFIGIGGVSMSALARLLHERGVLVRGSDERESGRTRQLRACGIPVHIGVDECVEESLVVITGAIPPEHPQLVLAQRQGATILTRAELLGKVAARFPVVVSVAGCHGKTSTVSMLAHIFAAAGRAFTSHVGGEDLTFSNYHSTGGATFLTEACEFRRSFLSLQSTVGVILNTELDHSDCYASQEELTRAYRAFARRCEKLVVNADDVRARDIPHAISFGLTCGVVRATRLYSDGECYTFTIVEGSLPLVRVRLRVPGKFQIYNALAAFCAARLAGISAEDARRGLERFCGVRRRFERVGSFSGVPVVCDYAHHPSEIAATFETAARMTSGTVRLVFQPHTYSRTRDLMHDFVSVLKRAESPLIYKTFAAREQFDFAGSAPALVSRLPEARYVQSEEQLRIRLKENLRPEDLILILGAGDIDEIARGMLD